MTFPNGKVQNVHHIGEVLLSNTLKLSNVLHFPSFKYNLLSVNQLSRQSQIMVIFYPTHYYLQDMRTKELIAVGGCIEGLYRLADKSFCKQLLLQDSKVAGRDPQENSLNASICIKEPDIWHLKLGHASDEALSYVPNLNHLNNSTNYQICPIAKQHSLNVTSYRHELLHFDLWGPYKKASKRGAYYFLL